MEYVEVKCVADQNTDTDFGILTALMGELGFESFSEEENTLLAYIPSANFKPSIIRDILQFSHNLEVAWSVIPDQNWNQVWEENFKPVTINNRCHIRAPFHPENKDVEFDLIIEPKMSFGTAHHETTAGMISAVLDTQMKGKSVLDMGCGTGVLAILAAKKGASPVMAVDNDEWAYRNTLENIQRNNTSFISVYHGDASMIEDKQFDIILANINRNILLQDMPVYAKALVNGGLIFLSGFYRDDLQIITESANNEGLIYKSHREENNWIAACFSKR